MTCILGNSGDIFFPKLSEDQMVSFKDITENFFKYLRKKIHICESEIEAKECFNIGVDSIFIDNPSKLINNYN